MAQFDIFVNPHLASRPFVPYFVDVQSDLIEQLSTRLFMPLSRAGVMQSRLPSNLCPVVEVDDERLSLLAYLAAPVFARLLKKPIASLRYRAKEINAALDVVVSGI